MAGDLAGLVNRLEAVTTRLEAVAGGGASARGGASGATSEPFVLETVDISISDIV